MHQRMIKLLAHFSRLLVLCITGSMLVKTQRASWLSAFRVFCWNAQRAVAAHTVTVEPMVLLCYSQEEASLHPPEPWFGGMYWILHHYLVLIQYCPFSTQQLWDPLVGGGGIPLCLSSGTLRRV